MACNVHNTSAKLAGESLESVQKLFSMYAQMVQYFGEFFCTILTACTPPKNSYKTCVFNLIKLSMKMCVLYAFFVLAGIKYQKTQNWCRTKLGHFSSFLMLK